MNLSDITEFLHHQTKKKKKVVGEERERPAMATSHFMRLQVVKFDSINRYYFDIPFPVCFFIVFNLSDHNIGQ